MQVKLEEIIQSIYFLPQEVLDDVLGNFKHLEYPKNHFLLKLGKPRSSKSNREKRQGRVLQGQSCAFGNYSNKNQRPGFYFERINGKVFIEGLNLKDNSDEYIGYKIEKTPISSSWKKAFGNYIVCSAIPCEECAKMGTDFKNFSLSIVEEDGLIKITLGGKGIEFAGKLTAICESENCAITTGIGRGNGETFRILENGNIYYSGFEFKRNDSKK